NDLMRRGSSLFRVTACLALIAMLAMWIAPSPHAALGQDAPTASDAASPTAEAPSDQDGVPTTEPESTATPTEAPTETATEAPTEAPTDVPPTATAEIATATPRPTSVPGVREVDQADDVFTGALTVHLTADSEPLAGACFSLFFSSGNVRAGQCDKADGDNDGT